MTEIVAVAPMKHDGMIVRHMGMQRPERYQYETDVHEHTYQDGKPTH
jgi:hypothetical protein